MHVSKIIPRERVIQQTVEQVVEISVPMTQGNIVLMPTVVNHRRHHHVEQEVIFDVHARREKEEIIHASRIILQERVIQQTVDQVACFR